MAATPLLGETMSESEDVRAQLDRIEADTRAARDEAAGAHAQARRTNGRMDRMEDVVLGPERHRESGLVYQVGHLARQVRRLREGATADSAVRGYRRWIVATAVAAIASMVGVLGLLLRIVGVVGIG